MAKRPMGNVLQYLNTFLAPQSEKVCSDGQLLQRFIHGRNEDAFAALAASSPHWLFLPMASVQINLKTAE